MSGALTTAASVSRGIGGVAALAGGLLGGGYLSGVADLGAWAAGMQTASWRGLPFGVRESTVRRGRKTALHEYPYRDDVWVEDLGRSTRITTFRGFLIGDDVFAQQAAMIAAAEQPGTGTLVHPALGLRLAVLTNFAASQRAETGRSIELEFEFTESSAVEFPTIGIATQAATASAATLAGAGVLADFTAVIGSALTAGAAVVGTITGTVGAWCGCALGLIGDAALVADALTGLVNPTGSYGRFSMGSRATPLSLTATEASVLASTVAAVAAVQTAATAATASVASGSPAAICAAAASVPAAIIAAASDPSDQIRLLSALAVYVPPVPTYTDPLGLEIVAAILATAAMLRAQALIALGQATAQYQPASYNDALTTLDSVTGLLDDGATAAANAFQGRTYAALRALRTAVAQDLSVRGAQLPPLVMFDFGAPMPALVLAWRLYADPTRETQIANGAGAINPGFVASPFQALSS
jgi:prophage DNA circulation protein